jgi:prolipoprotein diacylglyceryl transferase
MVPVLFHVGSVPVRTHEFFTLMGVLAGVIFLVIESRRRGMFDHRLLWLTLGALVGGAIGARLGVVGRYLFQAPSPSVAGALIEGGKTILGGLAGAYLGVLLAKRLIGYRGHMGDLFAPAVAIALAIGRVGCFLTEQVGTPTSLPWGISVSPDVAARIPMCPTCSPGIGMHPSFLYEIAFHAVMFALLLTWLRPRARVPGELFTIYLVAYATFRFAVEFVRGNEVLVAGLTGPQVFLLVTAPLLALRFVAERRTVRVAAVPVKEM